MAGKLLMGQKELKRSHIMVRISNREMTLKEGAKQLRLSYRQTKRLYARYKSEGAQGLIHRNQGKPSHNRVQPEMREQALSAYQQRYYDAGPTFAAEKLASHEGIVVSRETMRQWLIAEGLWRRKRRSTPYRSRRERKQCFGELVQFDGSHHQWFQERGASCCLMNMVDDATGRSLAMLFEQETIEAAMTLLAKWIERYGIPQALYCDRKNVYVSNREPDIAEQLSGITPQSHFERACEQLGIEVITASSPQAKGRLERSHAVYQDRFVKELRLRGISTINQANEFLEDVYLVEHNKKFTCPPVCSEDAHVPLGDSDIREIMCVEETRVVSRDYIISYKKRLFQITQDNRLFPRPGDRITVRVRLDKSVDLYFRNTKLSYREIPKVTKKEAVA